MQEEKQRKGYESTDKGRKKIEKDMRKYGKSDKVIERQENLAEALRANLRRRKEQKISIQWTQ